MSHLTPEPGLPREIAEEISALQALDDSELWDIARSRLPEEAAEQLEALHARGRQETLAASQTQELEDLVCRYERQMLLRARAAALLKQRGHDVAELLRR